MTTARGRLLLRSLPVLFALFVAFLVPPAAGVAHTGPAVTTASSPVIVSFGDVELDDRTAAAPPAETTGDAAAGPLTVTRAVADRARALTTQSTAGAASSRAPPLAA